jgi:hypothetical protein
MWETQQAFADEEKEAGMAVITDVGTCTTSTLSDKETVAVVLALLALNRTTGFASVKADSPR